MIKLRPFKMARELEMMSTNENIIAIKTTNSICFVSII
jgi:hypothetical protein